MSGVSVIVPVFNSQEYLERCLSSLHAQTFKDVEFICVDDGSNDESIMIMKRYASMDDRFRIIENSHSGVSASRNIGMDSANSKYICFLDSDDSFHKNTLRILFDTAESDNCDVVKFNAKTIHGDKWMKDSFLRHDELIEDFKPEDIFRYKDCRPFVWSHFIRRTVIGDVRFNESLILGEDQEFIIRYMVNAKRVRFLNKKLYNHYNIPDSNFNRLSLDPDEVCNNHIMLVESVISEVNIDSVEFAEWIFDTLYVSFTKSCMTKNNMRRIQELFEKCSLVDRLQDAERLRKLKQFMNTR